MARLKYILELLAAAATTLALPFGVYQLWQTNRTLALERANQAVSHFLGSDEMLELAKRIRSKTNGGTQYTADIMKDSELRGDVNNYLNNLEQIAYFTNKKLYDLELIQGQLANIIYKQANVHLLCNDGSLPGGEPWKTYSECSFRNANQFPELRKVYSAWFPHGKFVDYSDR
ncbi:hypothetical protein MW290_32175 (plasmid) [Aquincola tertiaricarbonis]|uniref:Uncharacterized protein n=1 Tax=Aquincola tertiaricarbonis TaxID=391953 RepID=A0ABY4SF86_AQUTE|nr:hypothetical protein [Aquincola tertiaricarbonis]URI11986.1 hypothetical protein MW290_32175 [Aquincola tertiaricarbonis]